MEVFSTSDLEEVVENQGKLFEYAEEHCPNIDVADLIETYMKSHTRAMIDENRLCMDKWRGQNLLGKVLMRVREDIRLQNKVTRAFQNVEKAFSGVAEEA